MNVRAFFRGSIGRSLALLTSFALVAGGAPRVFAQPSTSTLAGVILDPAGAPAKGFKVVFRDVASNTSYTSAATDAAGNYSVEVPLGGRYKIDTVIAADGVTNLPVQDVPPVSVLTAGTTRVNVRFTSSEAPMPQTAGDTAAAEEKKKGATPWYKRPGPIVGMVLGAGAIAALALNSGSSNNNASPSK